MTTMAWSWDAWLRMSHKTFTKNPKIFRLWGPFLWGSAIIEAVKCALSFFCIPNLLCIICPIYQIVFEKKDDFLSDFGNFHIAAPFGKPLKRGSLINMLIFHQGYIPLSHLAETDVSKPEASRIGEFLLWKTGSQRCSTFPKKLLPGSEISLWMMENQIGF